MLTAYSTMSIRMHQALGAVQLSPARHGSNSNGPQPEPNTAVVALLNSGAVKDDSLMHLMRCLTFVAAKFNFY